jgi:hypothetical protein
MRAGKRQARGREGPRTRLEVQTDGERIERRAYEPADTRDPHSVTEYELLAENMPSVLRRLRRTDVSSNGMLRYLMTKRR